MSAPASRKASVAAEPSAVSRQATTASPAPAPAQEVTTVETPVGTVVTTEEVQVQEAPAAPAPATQPAPSVKSSVRSAKKSAKSAPVKTPTFPPPSKAPTTYVTGEIPPAPLPPTVESANTTSSSLPPAQPVQQPQIQITAGADQPAITITKQHTATSSSDWERPQRTMAAQQPNYEPKVRYEQEDEGNPWETSFFGCFDHMGACMLSYCCPCILYSRNEHRMEEPSMETWSGCDSNALLSCLIMGCLPCVGQGLPQLFQRRKVRKRFNLKGDTLTDVAYSLLFPCCAGSHIDNEIKAQHERGHHGHYHKQHNAQYQQRSAGMVYGNQGTSSSSSSLG